MSRQTTKKVLVISTGGTIDSVSQTSGGLSPAEKSGAAEDIISFAARKFENCTVEHHELFKLDSSNIQPEEWQQLAIYIDKHRKSYDGMVITHGTDTLAYTSSMLSYMLRGIDIPVVLTGSQLPISHPLTDAAQNLYTAFQMALSPVAGVFVAFDRKIIVGTRAVKARTRSFNAFESINCPPAAVVDTRGLVLNHELPKSPVEEYSFCPEICKEVFLLKLVPGTGPGVLRAIAQQGCKGMVLETFGAGGIHTLRRNLAAELKQITDFGIAVVVVSQCLYEPSDFTLYEVGRQTLSAGVIEGRDMTSEAAVTKLMWALGNLNGMKEIRKFFNSCVAGEIKIDE